MQAHELLAFCQSRMSQAYAEQVWAVALVGGMSGFVISQARTLLDALAWRALSWGVRLAAMLALLFVWSRHGIYGYYHAWARKIMAGQSAGGSHLMAGEDIWRQAAGWSGVILYTLIIAGMSYAALRVLKKNAAAGAGTE